MNNTAKPSLSGCYFGAGVSLSLRNVSNCCSLFRDRDKGHNDGGMVVVVVFGTVVVVVVVGTISNGSHPPSNPVASKEYDKLPP